MPTVRPAQFMIRPLLELPRALMRVRDRERISELNMCISHDQITKLSWLLMLQLS